MPLATKATTHSLGVVVGRLVPAEGAEEHREALVHQVRDEAALVAVHRFVDEEDRAGLGVVVVLGPHAVVQFAAVAEFLFADAVASPEEEFAQPNHLGTRCWAELTTSSGDVRPFGSHL